MQSALVLFVLEDNDMRRSYIVLRLSPIALGGALLLACADDTFVPQVLPDSGNPDDTGAGTDGGNGGKDVNSIPDSSPKPDSGLTCNAPMANCSGNPVDGCNVNLSNDNANCGGCNIVCNTTCAAGVCPLIAADAGAPPKVADFACLAIDSKNVYWSTGLAANAGGSVYSVPINGGNPNLVIGGQDHPHAIASDGTNVFYGNAGTGNNTGGIYKVAIGGGQPTLIANNQASPYDLVLDATTVYWTNIGDGTIWSSDKNSPNPQKIGGGGGLGHASRLQVDSQNVYWTDTAASAVNRMPLAGGNTITMSAANSAPGARAIAIDSTNAYVASNIQTVGGILKLPLNASSASPQQLIMNQTFLGGIATNGTQLYWANLVGNGTINRASVTGQGSTALATGQSFPNCIALDAQSVYWINLGGGTISKTAK